MTMAGIAIAAAPALIGAGAGIGASYLSKDSGAGGGGMSPYGMQQTQREIRQLPDYPESEGARVNWWDTLQQWQGQEGYGAISPDWDAIWKSASDKVKSFYSGGPEGQGEVGRAKANLARRGVSEQPAADNVLARIGFQQGNTLSDMAVEQSTKRAEFGEKGRETWLSSLQALAGLKPQYMAGDSVTTNFDYQEPEDSSGGFLSSLLEPGGMGTDLISGFLEGDGKGQEDTGIGDIVTNFLSSGDLSERNELNSMIMSLMGGN